MAKPAPKKPAAKKPAIKPASKPTVKAAAKPKKMPMKKPAPAAPAPKAVSKPAQKPVTASPKLSPTPTQKPKVSGGNYFYANGKRKTSIARIKLFQSKENTVVINERPLEQYFTMNYHQMNIRSPFKITGTDGKFNVQAQVFGGGVNSQADAIRHGITKALLAYDQGLRLTLKRAGFLTRDARVKERKKPGLHRARRGPQFSKR